MDGQRLKEFLETIRSILLLLVYSKKYYHPICRDYLMRLRDDEGPFLIKKKKRPSGDFF